jgi:hypothetical protein
MKELETVSNEITKKIESLQLWVASGQCVDHYEYSRLCGEIRGLSYARDYAKDLIKYLEHSDDD